MQAMHYVEDNGTGYTSSVLSRQRRFHSCCCGNASESSSTWDLEPKSHTLYCTDGIHEANAHRRRNTCWENKRKAKLFPDRSNTASLIRPARAVCRNDRAGEGNQHIGGSVVSFAKFSTQDRGRRPRRAHARSECPRQTTHLSNGHPVPGTDSGTHEKLLLPCRSISVVRRISNGDCRGVFGWNTRYCLRARWHGRDSEGRSDGAALQTWRCR